MGRPASVLQLNSYFRVQQGVSKRVLQGFRLESLVFRVLVSVRAPQYSFDCR